jgi:group I intron endonuclease
MIKLRYLISHKYLNHGTFNVPIFNISNPMSPLLSEAGRMMVVLTVKAKLRAHSYYLGAICRVERTKIIKFLFNTVPVTSRRGLNLINLTGVALFIFFAHCFAGEAIVLVANFDALPDANFYLSISSFSQPSGTVGIPAPVKSYENASSTPPKKLIIKENENKSGIYRWTNKCTPSGSAIYIGQSVNLSARFIHYFNTSYLSSRKQLIISRALIKYGYSEFSLEILEYCEKSDLLEREQYYIDLLKPEYNILKIAGSSLGFKHSEDTKAKISKSLKGIYVGKNSALFGRVHSEETKALMSIKKLSAGDKNHNFGRTLSEETKELIRLRAQGRIHSEETKALMSQKHGDPINIYEKVSGEFSLIGSFVSRRKAAQFLEISAGTVTRYMQSGKLFKDKYKFSRR